MATRLKKTKKRNKKATTATTVPQQAKKEDLMCHACKSCVQGALYVILFSDQRSCVKSLLKPLAWIWGALYTILSGQCLCVKSLLKPLPWIQEVLYAILLSRQRLCIKKNLCHGYEENCIPFYCQVSACDLSNC